MYARRTARRLRRLPLAISVAARHVGHDHVAAESLAWRALPAGLRGRLLRVIGRWRGVRTALGLAADGQRDAARQVLRDQIDDGSVRGSIAAGRAAAAIGERELARAALTRNANNGRRASRLSVQVLLAEGRLRATLAEAATLRGPAGRRLRRHVAGELAALAPGTRIGPVPAAGRVPPSAPRPARKVLHVVTNSLPAVQAGYTVRTHGVAVAQNASGTRAAVVTRLGFPVDAGVLDPESTTTLDGVDYHRLLPPVGVPATAERRLDATIRSLGRLVDEVRPDVLHAHSKHDNAQVALAVGRARSIPVVYEVRGFLEETWRSRGGDPTADAYLLARQAETECMAAADAVITLSETMRREITGRGIDPGKVHVGPNAVDESFLDALPDGAEVRRRYGIAPDAVVFGTATTLNGYEGLDTLIDALALSTDPRLRLLIVGTGPEREHLTALAAPLGDRVVLTGAVPHREVAAHLAAMDVFCVPRRRTPVTELVPPLKPLEALAAGVPIAVADLPPLRELHDDAAGGWCVAGDTATDWAELFATAADDPASRAEFGNHGRDWVRQNRTWAILSASYATIYSAIL